MSPSCESWIEENDKWLNGDQTSSISANNRVTPHSTTGVAPSELLMNRKLRTQPDAALPDLEAKVMLRELNKCALLGCCI